MTGFLVNKFRGDPSLFRPAMDFIADRTGWPGLGLVRYFRDAARLPAEDAVALDSWQTRGSGPFTIAVPRLAHIANFDDLDPLRLEPSLRVVMVEPGRALPGECRSGDPARLKGHNRGPAGFQDGTAGISICALMFAEADVFWVSAAGTRCWDIGWPIRMASRALPGTTPGLGLLDIETTLTRDKTLVEVSGISIADGEPFRGYEMHIGQTAGPDCDRPLLRFADGRLDGADFGRRSRSRHVRARVICR